MSKLNLSFACAPYDRIFPLINGLISPEGIQLIYLPLEVEEIFWRQLRHQEFDISEMSLSSYIISISYNDERFIAIPVFTSRMFRHSCVFVNSKIETPEDLKGKIVGVPEYQLTAIVWMRGILQHEYGIHPSEIHWRYGGLETPGREEKVKIELPHDIDYKPIPQNRTLSEMLEKGEIDAIIAPRKPSCYIKGSSGVKRLFENYKQVEREFYTKTQIFPIMHTIVIKRSIYKAHPWVANSLYKAFLKSKEICLTNLKKVNALHAMIPWLNAEVEETIKLMGEDYWQYGIEKNLKTIETLCQYSFEQGLAKRRVSIDELFARETFDAYKV